MKGYRAEYRGVGYHGPAVSGGPHLVILGKVVDGLKSGVGRPVYVEVEPEHAGRIAWSILESATRHFPDQAVCNHERKVGHRRAGGVSCADCGAPLPADPSYPPSLPVPIHSELVRAAQRLLDLRQRGDGPNRASADERKDAWQELQNAITRTVWFTEEGEPKRLLKDDRPPIVDEADLRHAQTVADLGHIYGVKLADLKRWRKGLKDVLTAEQQLRLKKLRLAFKLAGNPAQGGEAVVKQFRRIKVKR